MRRHAQHAAAKYDWISDGLGEDDVSKPIERRGIWSITVELMLEGLLIQLTDTKTEERASYINVCFQQLVLTVHQVQGPNPKRLFSPIIHD